MTRDPYQVSIYDPGSMHRYNYARSNPANFIDPSGRASAAEYGAVVLVIVAEKVAVVALGARSMRLHRELSWLVKPSA